MTGFGYNINGFGSFTSRGLPAPEVVGEAYQGGFYAGDISTAENGEATHYLVIGPLSTTQQQGQWKNDNEATSGATSAIDGPQNTADMVADGNSTVYPAAHFCNDLTIGGFSDWYMPANNELEVCYYSFKPTATSNNTSYGANPHAVPARAGNYSTGTPAQTSVSAFQTTAGTQSFRGANYWPSTEYSDPYAYRKNFVNGINDYENKTVSLYYVRAVRRLAV